MNKTRRMAVLEHRRKAKKEKIKRQAAAPVTRPAAEKPVKAAPKAAAPAARSKK